MEYDKDLQKRLLDFSVNVIEGLRKLDNSIEHKVIKYQLIKAASSVGANYEEAQAASSTADFLNKIRIALKEIREASYWIQILQRINHQNIEDLNIETLNKESEELKKILGSIASKVSKK